MKPLSVFYFDFSPHTQIRSQMQRSSQRMIHMRICIKSNGEDRNSPALLFLICSLRF